MFLDSRRRAVFNIWSSPWARIHILAGSIKRVYMGGRLYDLLTLGRSGLGLEVNLNSRDSVMSSDL